MQQTYNPEILVVTDGSNGGYYYENGKAVHYDSVKVQAVDTNGAGDTFHGAFVSQYIEGKDVAECCRFASAVSAYKCLHHGVRDFELNKSIIYDFIKNIDDYINTKRKKACIIKL